MSLGRAIATVGGFTLVSRVVGFLRDVVLSAVLGAGPIADAFVIALKLPNFFRRLFAEGAFSAAFVPLFARELHDGGREAALTFARQAQAVLLVVLLPLSVLAIVAMPWVMRALAPGLADEATFELAVDFGRITFPYLLFISLMSLYGGVLNGIERFAHVAATPILLNLTLIAAVLGLTPFLPNGGYAAAIGVALSGVAQWLWLLWACRREDVVVRLARPRLTERVRRLVVLAAPIAIGGGAQQISLMLDVVWASLMPAGAIAALYYADRLAQLPLGVAGVAIGTALLPLLARNLRSGDEEAAMDNQNRAVELGLLFALPAAAALWILAEPITRLLFERGQFIPSDTVRAASALSAFAVGIPAFVAIKALTPGFFAREDTRTPLYTAIISIIANIALNIVFLYATNLQHVGIALASSLAGWLNLAMLMAILVARGHWIPDTRLWQRSFGILLATAGMSLPLVLASQPGDSDLKVLALCAGGGALYVALGMLLRVVRLDELRAALRRPPGVKREMSDSE
ncbi:MAG TPA: murein biosynthesis integral membrane protein MurJ [Reyranellaceae bacterium]|nr:murein biosynthesis integral membrane protein MurJ [Reyranellaceae bacterium]